MQFLIRGVFSVIIQLVPRVLLAQLNNILIVSRDVEDACYFIENCRYLRFGQCIDHKVTGKKTNFLLREGFQKKSQIWGLAEIKRGRGLRGSNIPT